MSLESHMQIIVRPRMSCTWEEFTATHPPFSIAIDGYVKGPPKEDFSGPWMNLNHHEGSPRIATRSSAAQLYTWIKGGLLDTTYQIDGIPELIMCTKEMDEDEILTLWIAANATNYMGEKSNPLVTRLVEVSDKLDALSGCYPIRKDSTILQELNHLYEPYRKARIDPEYTTYNEDQFLNIMFEAWERIDDYVVGNGRLLPLDTRYETIGEHEDWKFIQEIGPNAAVELRRERIPFVLMARGQEGKCYRYSCRKVMPAMSLNLEAMFDYLNAFEKQESWGGGDTTGGCLLQHPSNADHKEVQERINDFMRMTPQEQAKYRR